MRFGRLRARPASRLLAAAALIVLALAAPGPTSAAFSGVTANPSNMFTAAPSFGCTAQTFTVPADRDTFLDQEQPTSSYGSNGAVGTRSWAAKNRRALLHFPLPAAPEGCVLSSAFLRVYAYIGSAGRTLHVYPVSAAWTEAATWNTQPATTGTPTSAAFVANWMQWTVTSDVAAQYAGTNHGFQIRDAAEDAGSGVSVTMHSRETPAPDAVPELVLRFAPTACASAGRSAAVVATADSWMSQLNPTTNYGTATSMNVASRTGLNSRALLQFTLPSVPEGCAPVAAQVQVMQITASTVQRTLGLYRANAAWSEGTVNWSNGPGWSGTPARHLTSTGQWRFFNLPATTIEAMYAGPWHGFLLRDTVEDASDTTHSQTFQTRENSSTPKIDVTVG